jgi:hypothetical protein
MKDINIESKTQKIFAFSISENSLLILIPLKANQSKPLVIARRRRYFRAVNSFWFMKVF